MSVGIVKKIIVSSANFEWILFRELNYISQKYNSNIKVGDLVFFVERDSFSRQNRSLTQRVEKIEISRDKNRMYLKLKKYNAVKEIFERIHKLELKEERGRLKQLRVN